MIEKRRLVASMTALAIGIVLGAATMVVAGNNGPITGTGTDINRVKTVTTNEHFEVTDANEIDLPGARVRLVLTASSTLVVARFTGPVDCHGDPGRCHAQVAVLDNNNGDALVATMQPVGHMSSTFCGCGHEGHSVEESITLQPGDYDFQVRLSTFTEPSDSVTFNIASWHFTVERIV